jgi:hypothetical protein
MKSMFESQMNLGCAQIAAGSICPQPQRRNSPKRTVMKSVKTVKSVFVVFQLETAVVQSVPTKIGRGDFTAFALILRMGMGGRGSVFADAAARQGGVNYEN